MELLQLKCFVAVAEELHFGRAAQRMEMLPASLGRHLRKLEDSFGVQLVERTTRHVALTEAGEEILEEARDLLARANAMEERARRTSRAHATVLRIGAIDSAAIGLVPQLLTFFRQSHPDIEVTLHEQKTIRLLPKLLSGRLDLAFVRCPATRNSRFQFRHLLSETTVVAMPHDHRLAGRESVTVLDLADEPLIVPERDSRPHSHDLTMKLFLDAGLPARVAQIAEEKHTIVNLVSSGLGLAVVPRWSSRMGVGNVSFIPIRNAEGAPIRRLDLSAAWVRDTRDPSRDLLLECLQAHLDEIAATG